MKQPPQFVSQLLALVLGGLGAAFVLMGALFTLLHVPMRSGQSWMFFALGLVFLGAAAACLLWARRKLARCRRLRERGVRVEGTDCTAEHRLWINWNVESLTTLPGKNSPWVVRCQYQWQGQHYTVTSCLLWAQPAPLQRPAVYLDPKHPRRAFLDPDTLSFLLF